MDEKMKALIAYLRSIAETHRAGGRAGAASEADEHADALRDFMSGERG